MIAALLVFLGQIGEQRVIKIDIDEPVQIQRLRRRFHHEICAAVVDGLRDERLGVPRF